LVDTHAHSYLTLKRLCQQAISLIESLPVVEESLAFFTKKKALLALVYVTDQMDRVTNDPWIPTQEREGSDLLFFIDLVAKASAAIDGFVHAL
jgi:hypothetical protein